MTEAAPFKPVFIDQTPEYKQAMQSLEALAQHNNPEALVQNNDRFCSVAEELGLSKELNKSITLQEALALQARALMGAQEEVDTRTHKAVESFVRRCRIVGDILATAAGGIAGYIVGKRWGTLKGILTGVATAMAATGIWSFSSPTLMKTRALKIFEKDNTVLAKDYDTLRAQEEQWQQQFTDTQRQLLAQMATRILEEQKMLVGQGADAKLVSTAQPSAPQESKAAKHATPPAASYAEAVAQSQQPAVVQR